LLQNFRFPEVYKLFQDDDKDIYNNKFHLGNNRINWEAPEINNSECEIDHEKIDIFAIGKFIECIKPDPSSILFRLYECMIQTEPSKRPSYKKCIHFLENQGALPHYTLLQPDLPPMRQVKSTKIYDYKKISSQYFLRNFKVQEITVKIPSYIPTIRNYIKNMKYLSDTSEKNGCFLKVFSILEETNQFTLITEHCTNNMEKKVFNMEKNYSNSDLWDIVTPLFYVVDTYSKHGIFHGNLCLKNLKINDENYLKISGFLFYGKDLIDDFEVVEELQRKNNLAPEVLKAAEEVKDGRDKLEDIDFGKADVYSLGITLIEIATKTSRREMNIENDRKMKKIIDKQENINDEMKETLKKMIEREPQKRYDITSCVKFLPVESREKSYLSIQVNK
jgi:serine/threonine protein kinase